MKIDRCVCYQRSFSELKAIAEKTGATALRELQKHVKFGFNCGLCHPYVRRMLQTGETVFSDVASEVGSLPEDE